MSELPKHVLLIEDNSGDADLIRLRLVESKTPVEVSRVERLSEGLASLDHETPSLVLLDLNLSTARERKPFAESWRKPPTFRS